MLTRRQFVVAAGGAGLAVAAMSSARGQKRTTLRVGVQPVMISPMWNALAQGLFKKEGVDLEFIKFTTGPSQTAALRSGVIDLAFGAAVAFYSIRSNGANVQWPATVGNFNSADGIVVGPTSRIKSVRDLKGKKIALPFYTVVHGPLLLLLKENDIPVDSVELINLAPPQAAAAVLSGAADAAFAWPPFINEVANRGGRMLLHAKDTPGGGWSWTGFAANGDWVKKNVNLLAAFYKAFDQGRQGMGENRDLIVKTAGHAVGMPEDAALREFGDLKFPALVDNVTADTPISMCAVDSRRGLARTLDQARTFYTRTGQVKTPATYTDYFNPAPLNQVFGKNCKV